MKYEVDLTIIDESHKSVETYSVSKFYFNEILDYLTLLN